MIHFCFRDTEDWENKAPYQKSEGFWEYCQNRSNRYECFKKYFDLWNKTQFVSYFQFRYELKELTKLSLQDNDVSEVKIENWRDLQDDDWIAPMDDDDWFCANLETAIKNTKDDFVIGDVLLYRTMEGKVVVKNRRNLFPSCGHAFRVGMLKQKFSDSDVTRLLEHHCHAKVFIERESVPYKILNETLACRLIHCGAASRMYREHNLKKFIANPKIKFGKMDIMKQPQWCRKYLRKFKKLGDQFHVIKLL